METMTPTARSLAETIKVTVTAFGLSLRDVAERAGIPNATLHRKLNTTPRLFTFDELSAIAGVLGIRASDLIAEAEKRDAR